MLCDLLSWLMHSTFVGRGHGLGHGFPCYLNVMHPWLIHRRPWLNHCFPCWWDELRCWGHGLRHDFPSPALLSLWDVLFFDVTLTTKNLLIFMYAVTPLLHFLCHRGHGRALTFPMAAEGHGLACSSHGFLRLGCTACTLLLGEVGRIEKRWPALLCSLVWSVLFPPFQLGVYRISFSHWY